MAEKLTLESLKKAVEGNATALRCIAELQPAGGPGDKVFPPTYEGGKYAFEERVIDGKRVPCVLLDSVASQANRIELALLRGHRRKLFTLPLIEVDFSDSLPDVGRISSLEAPHRIADAILRDSVDDKKRRFRETEAGKAFTDASARNAGALYEWCPTALVLGIWDSTGPKGGAGAKFARCLVSEIVGIDAQAGARTSSRIDPLQIQKASGVLYAAKDGDWTLDEKKARQEKGKAIKLGKDGKPSEANHGNIAPSLEEGLGGVTVASARLVATLSLPGLRRLSFPKGRDVEAKRDLAGQVVLAALGLCGSVLAQSEGLDLRSRCLLVPVKPATWELVGASAADTRAFEIDAASASALLAHAIEDAKKAGLTWHGEGLTLAPMPEVVTLVKASRALSASGHAEEAD